MNQIQALFHGDGAQWLDGLPKYQRDLIAQLLSSGSTPEEAAEQWLTVVPCDTAPFGAEPNSRQFMDRVWDEVAAFLCGDLKYDADRKRLLAESKATHAYVVGAISTAIGPVVGVSAPLVAPMVALLLLSLGKCVLNAWCAGRKQRTTS